VWGPGKARLRQETAGSASIAVVHRLTRGRGIPTDRVGGAFLARQEVRYPRNQSQLKWLVSGLRPEERRPESSPIQGEKGWAWLSGSQTERELSAIFRRSEILVLDLCAANGFLRELQYVASDSIGRKLCAVDM